MINDETGDVRDLAAIRQEDLLEQVYGTVAETEDRSASFRTRLASNTDCSPDHNKHGELASAPMTGDWGLTDCNNEQLHLSGRIQAHGALVAADLKDLRITHVSANSQKFIGVRPDRLFDAPVESLFAADEHPRLKEAIEQTGHQKSSPDLYGMELAARSGDMADVILHRAGQQLIIEVESSCSDDQADRSEVLFAFEAIGSASSVPEVEAAVAHALRMMTGFDRAMVYRFHDDEHGEVVAEDCIPGLVRYLGHHFPASDIPRQAREIYTRKAIRYIPDVDEGDVAVITSPRVAGASLDLSYAAMRSVSPFHLEYMRNMKTAASISFAMVTGGRLTRMVTCTSQTPRFLARSRRRSCELAVLQAKTQIVAAEQIAALNDLTGRESIRQRLRASIQRAPTIAAGLFAASDDLPNLCRADGAAACIDGRYEAIGTAVQSEDVVRSFARQRAAAGSPLEPWSTDRLPTPAAAALGAAGCLFILLSRPEEFIVWFRRDRPQQLRWLGDPNANHAGSINPRTSFDTWLAEATGSSAPWTSGDLQAAKLMAIDIESAQLVRARIVQLERNATFEAVYANAPIGIAVVGLDGTFQRVNKALCRITGYPEDELINLTFQDITHPDDLDTDVSEATRLMRGEIPNYQMDKRYYAKDGRLLWIHLSVSLVHDANGEPLHFISHIEDISARRRDEELLRRQATRDALTGLYNRSRFQEELSRHQAQAARYGHENDQAAILMIDVDGLKKVNDQYGHAAGDDYLKSVANTISRRLRLSDAFARLGGDEFAALLPHTSAEHARRLARTLVEQVQTNTRGTVSIGIAMLDPGHQDVLERADQAMYHAKRQGGSRAYGP